MYRKIALHFSLDYSDSESYGTLSATHESSELFSEITRESGFELIGMYKDQEATRVRLISQLNHYSQTLKKDDILFFSFCGHGARTKRGAFHDEIDGKNEAICLSDGPLMDDELFEIISQFTHDVRLIIILDSCHSGGMNRAFNNRALLTKNDYLLKKKSLEHSAALLRKDYKRIKASVSMIASAAENQFAQNGSQLTWFARQIKQALSGYKKPVKYIELINKLNKKTFNQQTIQCRFLGSSKHFWNELIFNPVTFKSKYNAQIKR